MIRNVFDLVNGIGSTIEFKIKIQKKKDVDLDVLSPSICDE